MRTRVRRSIVLQSIIAVMLVLGMGAVASGGWLIWRAAMGHFVPGMILGAMMFLVGIGATWVGLDIFHYSAVYPEIWNAERVPTQRARRKSHDNVIYLADFRG